MVMEPMVGDSLLQRENMERSKFRSGLKTKNGQLIGKRKRALLETDDQEGAAKDDPNHGHGDEKIRKKSKVKGPKEPNPLSVKKSKKAASHAGRDEHQQVSDPLRKPEEAVNAADGSKVVPEPPPDGQHENTNKRKRKRKHKSKASREVVDAAHSDNEYTQ